MEVSGHLHVQATLLLGYSVAVSASRLYSSPGERATSTHLIEGCVVLKANLNTVEQRRLLLFRPKWTMTNHHLPFPWTCIHVVCLEESPWGEEVVVGHWPEQHQPSLLHSI
jgi:hypothetical protein